MKIKRLKINKYRGLENLEFDFRYPENYKDHSKAGKPLDKICFIGQSASGKTNLLNLIFETALNATRLETIDKKAIANFRNELANVDGEIEYEIGNKSYIQKNNSVVYDNRNLEKTNSGGAVHSLIPLEQKRNIIYIKSELISTNNIDIFSKNPLDLLNEFNELKSHVRYPTDENYIGHSFDSKINPEIWLFLLNEILEYRKNFTQKMSDLIHKGLIANQRRLSTEFKKWQQEHPNVLESFANKFNPIIEKLNLEVDLINTEYTIPISKKASKEIIPIKNTSTGTKGLLLTFLPLFKLDTKESIILIDEPERSLYPDMQIGLLEHYFNIAPQAQFIVATHSPFIAASFEPEERFVLYFDDNGNVQVRQGKSPIGDDPNDLLKNDFGVNYYNKYGIEAYQKYLDLKQKVSNEKNSAKKKELMLEMVKLGNEYNF